MKNTKKFKINFDNLLNFLIIILVILSIILGYFVVKQTGFDFAFKGLLKNTTKDTLDRGSSPSANTIQVPAIKNKNLSKEEISAMNFPPREASEEDRRKHFELVKSLAKRVDVLEIDDCIATPLIIEIGEGKTFKIRNKDSVAHTLVLNPDKKFEVGANSTIEVNADFGKGRGLYGYACDQEGPAGIFIVAP